MKPIAETELIINPRGAVYHLDLRPEEIADTIITVGDPDRVKEVSKYFDKVDFRIQHREITTHTGFIGRKRISVISTGMGPDNIDIVFNELDALFNIDLETRTVKHRPVSLNIIRIGTCGGLQPDIPLDSLVTSTHGLGIDNLLHYYRYEQNDEEKQLLHSFVTHTQLHGQNIYPYLSGASPSLLRHFVSGFHQGITVTCPGFYGPQGRVLRMGVRNPELLDQLTGFRFGAHRIANFEMETSAIYGLGKLLGHHCISLSVVVAHRVQKKFSKNAAMAVESLIRKTLETITENI